MALSFFIIIYYFFFFTLINQFLRLICNQICIIYNITNIYIYIYIYISITSGHINICVCVIRFIVKKLALLVHKK